MGFTFPRNRKLSAAVKEYRELYGDRIAWEIGLYEAAVREEENEQRREESGVMREPVKAYIQRLRHPIKRLLAQEMDIKEVAKKLDKHPSTIREVINYYDLGEFVQPGKRKIEWRARNTIIRQVALHPYCKDHLPKVAGYHFKKIRSEGWRISYNEVHAIVALAYAKSFDKFDPNGKAQFTTYAEKAVINHLKEWRRKEAQRTKFHVPYEEVTVKAEQANQPRRLDDKYVAA